jgi:hypothetical protein
VIALHRPPDLTEALRDGPVDVKQQFYEPFDLQIVYDKHAGHVSIRAAVTEAVAEAMEAGPPFAGSCSGGGRIRTCEGSANRFTADPL